MFLQSILQKAGFKIFVTQVIECNIVYIVSKRNTMISRYLMSQEKSLFHMLEKGRILG